MLNNINATTGICNGVRYSPGILLCITPMLANAQFVDQTRSIPVLG